MIRFKFLDSSLTLLFVPISLFLKGSWWIFLFSSNEKTKDFVICFSILLNEKLPSTVSFSLNGAHSSPDYERRRGSAASAGAVTHSSSAHMRAAASVDRLNMMGEGNSGRKLPSMPDSMQRSPLKISGREGEIAALKRTNRRSASSQNLVNSADGEQLFFFRSHELPR